MDISLRTLIKLEAEARARSMAYRQKADEEKELADFYYRQIKELDQSSDLALKQNYKNCINYNTKTIKIQGD